jgi:hypothetical protein
VKQQQRKAVNQMRSAFGDYYLCPAHFDDFRIRGELSDQPGYFRLREAVCYGRQSVGIQSPVLNGHLVDVADRVELCDGHVSLPFDFSEIVENLRFERYQQASPQALAALTSTPVSQRIYYFLRPILPVGIRKHLQRIRLSGWERIPFPKWPVDVTVETLMKTAMELLLRSTGRQQIPFVWFWPNGAGSAVIVTHDVEARAGKAFCDRLMDIDEESGLTSAFQIVPEERYAGADGLFAKVRSRGFEANVHDLNHDGALFKSREQFSKRAAQINEHVRRFESRGFRSGAMLREQEWLDELDISFDMSVPNVAHLEPQQGGCCTVMPYFIGDIVELPLTTAQDYSLFHILNDYSLSLWTDQIARLLTQNGLITVLTHPDYLIEKRAQAVYQQLLNHLRQLREQGKVWVALPGEVDRWWRSRNKMSVVDTPHGWQIVGEGSAEATLAFAELGDDGSVVYKMDCGTGATS